MKNFQRQEQEEALVLPVGGAFHSPLMEPAREELAAAIENTSFQKPICPVYQNVTASAITDPSEIKKNLVSQLTAPVRWTQTMHQMINDGAKEVIEVGPGKVLQGLFKKLIEHFLVAVHPFNFFSHSTVIFPVDFPDSKN